MRRLFQKGGEAGKREWGKGREGELLTPASELDSKMRERSQQDKYGKQAELHRDTV